MIPNSLPEGCPGIGLPDRNRILQLAMILESQTKLPFKHMIGVLEHVYMLGYLQAGIENADTIRKNIDAAITIMRPK